MKRNGISRPTGSPPAQGGTQSTRITVALLYHDSDVERVRQLAGLLSGAGVSVVPTTDADALVVFLSEKGLASPQWTAWVAEVADTATRLIPVRVGQIDDRRVPERLRELNWIDWVPGSPSVTFGYVIAGLLSDPGRRDLSRQLSHEAQAWERSGRSNELLMTDYRRARRMAGLLRDLEADKLAAPTAAMRQYVKRSVVVSRPRHRRRRSRLIVGITGAVVALLVAAVLLPRIDLGKFNNEESVTTSGDPELLQDLPEWSAANAAALLVNGTSQEKELARTTLLRALNEPWEIDDLQWTVTPNSAVPFDHGRLAVLSVNLSLAIIEVDTQRAVWTTTVPGGPYYLTVDPAGTVALGLSLSGDGAIVVNLDQHTVRRIAGSTDFASASLGGSYGQLGDNGVAVVRLPGPRLGELNTATGTVTALGASPPVLGIVAQAAGGTAAALVRAGDGTTSLIAVPSGEVLASLPGTPAATAGAISPDGRQAIVTGGDGQFWEIGAGQRAAPTGIPIPAVLSSVTWASEDRVVVASQDQRGQVYLLPQGELLGTICVQDSRLSLVIPDASAGIVSCEFPGGVDFWPLPPGPLAGQQPGETRSSSWRSGPVTVTRSGAGIDVRGPGVNSGVFDPLSVGVSVVDVASGGTRVVVGDALGEVAVIDVEAGFAAEVVTWTDPDHSPITAAGWDDGPVATTASGQTWRITDCANCGTDVGLLSAFRARITGCFSARQLAFIGSGTWQALGLRECTDQPGLPPLITLNDLGGS